MIDPETPVWKLTVGEFVELMNSSKPKPEPVRDHQKKYVYGIDGIAELFGCSRVTANAIKQGGKIDKAITQVGRKIVVDAELALSLLKIK